MSNGFNFFEYLLVMFLRIRQYKLASRNYLFRLLDQLHENCDCIYCGKIKLIRSELRKNGFGTFNKTVEWWRITEAATEISVLPEIDESE